MNSHELRMFNALKTITRYMSPDKLRREADKYGLEYEEALEMAYENVLQTAKDAIKGMRRPATRKAADGEQGAKPS